MMCIIVAKNKNSEIGMVSLKFDKSTLRYNELRQ